MYRQEDPTSGIEFVRTRLGESDYAVAGHKLIEKNGEYVEIEKSEQEIIAELRRTLPNHYWMLQDGYNDRKPNDAWEITIGKNTLQLFDYTDTGKLKRERVEEISHFMGMFAIHFGEYMPTTLKAVTITDHYEENLTPDGRFKHHAQAQPAAEMFELTPRALKKGIYRPDLRVPRLAAVVLHELAHFSMDEALAPNWPEDRTTSYSDEFGVMEDIPESAAAYFLKPRRLSQQKEEILLEHDHPRQTHVEYHHTPDFMPPEPPEVINYYVDNEWIEGQASNSV